MTPRTVCLAIVLSIALLAGPAYPQRTEGFSYEVSDLRGRKIDAVSIRGLERRDREQIRNGLYTTAEDALLYESTVEADRARIRLYLVRRGYPWSRVDVGVSPADDGKRASVEFIVSPGPPVKIVSFDVAGIPGGVSIVDETGDLPARGGVFREGQLDRYEERVRRALLEAGYATAKIDSRVTLVDSTGAVVTIRVEPGEICYFGGVRVDGVSGGIADLARISMDVERGERFHPKVAEDAKARLSRLNLFSRIRMSTEATAADTLLLVAGLSERRHGRFEIAVGYWSDAGGSGRMGWRHGNLFRRGRGMGFSVSWSRVRRYGYWTAWYPAVLGAGTVGRVRAGYNMFVEDSYEKESPQAAVSLGWNISGRTAAEFEVVAEEATYRINTEESKTFVDPEGAVWWLSARIDRDGTDDRLNPVAGTFSWARIECGPGGDVTNSGYLLAEVSGTVHVPLRSGLVLALNARAGGAAPLAGSERLLPDKRFYAGGSTSHRGFRRRKLGPQDGGGLPLGGRALAVGFAELRFPIRWKLNGAVFADWGAVWRTAEDVSFDTMQLAVGPGLRIMTPVGPIRFDVGYRVTDDGTDERKWLFHFAIGYPM